MTWPSVTLGDICEFKYGRSLAAGRRLPGEVPVYGSNGVVGSHTTALTNGPTIIVGRKGSLGEVHYSSTPCWPIDTTYYIDSSATSVDLKWLSHLLPTLRLTELNRAAAVPGLNRGDAYRRPLLLPPIEEQRRIAAILDQADALRAKRREALDRLDGLTQAIFLDIFGREARRAVSTSTRHEHSEGWQWLPLTDVARLATGHTPDRKRPEYWGGSIPWISLPEIRTLDGKVAEDTDAKVTEAGIANSSAVILPPGTVCFSRTASVGFVTQLAKPMATSQDFHNWIPGPRLDPAYLREALRASRLHLIATSDGSIHKTIYQRVAQRFSVLLPPLPLQRSFADLERSIASQRRALQSQMNDMDLLFSSLQHRAFSGRS